MVTAERVGAILTIDLDAIVANYRLLADRVGDATCAAVIKCDAYGCGVAPVARCLAQAGCSHFFVATLDEAITLRSILDDANAPPEIYMLNGLLAGAEVDYDAHRIIPVLNSLKEIETWSRHAAITGIEAPAIIHFDTGMSRLGLAEDEAETLLAEPDRLSGIRIAWLMSHLACADERGHPLNDAQHQKFDRFRKRLGGHQTSLANSAGIFLGPEFHGDLVRPGSAIFGLAPIANESNPMKQVVVLEGKILQIRLIDRDMTVGYGASDRATRKRRIATVAVGYGDGYLRSLGNRGSGFIGAKRIPVAGRISMDLTSFDVTDVPENEARPGAVVQLIGPHHSADALAAEAGTIGYEILTSLGQRYFRRYSGGATP
jgi:alanine racemase